MNSAEVNEYRENLQSRVIRIETLVSRIEMHLNKLNNRTGKLEAWRNWMVGAMAGLGFVIGIIKLGVM